MFELDLSVVALVTTVTLFVTTLFTPILGVVTSLLAPIASPALVALVGMLTKNFLVRTLFSTIVKLLKLVGFGYLKKLVVSPSSPKDQLACVLVVENESYYKNGTLQF